MVKVKICGIRDEAMLRAAVEAGADWVGFVFYPPSPRAVSLDTATALLRHPHGTAVALLVDPDDRLVDQVMATGISTLQLHGQESPERVSEIRERTGAEVWKAHGIYSAADLNRLNAFAAADAFLLDAMPPAGSNIPGGHGQTFDWAILDGWPPPKPWILSGGLMPDNVAAAIAATGAAAVDVSSGVERARGIKDEGLIRKFIAAAKAA